MMVLRNEILMVSYISAKNKGTHITNLARTTRFLSKACGLVFNATSQEKIINC